jgi:hypothetical protein
MRRLRPRIRRTIFALCRSFWDALDAVGDHALFAALSAVTVVVLILVFASRGDLLPALYSLAAVWVVFLVFVAFKFAQAFAHPDRQRDWDWLDYSGFEDVMRLELRSLAPLRPGPRPDLMTTLLCRVVAPDKTLWESSRFSQDVNWPGSPTLRFYPHDFKCPKCGQPPLQILVGEYEITWLRPWRGPVRRPLLRYTQRVSEREQAPESSEQAS